MKKLLYSDLVRILFAVTVTIALAKRAVAVEKKEARVTQVVREVRLLASKGAPRPASLNDNVGEGTAVRTGGDSRAELTFTDQTLTRLGANTIFSFGQGGRDFDLSNGAMLLCVPKESGAAHIKTAAVTAAITGGIAMAESHDRTHNSWCKFIILEGDGRVSLRKHPEQRRKLHAGQIIIFRCDALTLPEVHNVDLKKLVDTGNLFRPKLPAWAWELIVAEIDNQQTSPPSGILIDPTSHDIIDQRVAAEPAPEPMRHHPSPTPPPARPF